KQHKSPAQTTFLRFVLGFIFDDVKLLDDFLLSALNRGTKRLEVFHEVRVSAVEMEDIMHSGYFISAKCGADQSCTRTYIGRPKGRGGNLLLYTKNNMVAIDLSVCIDTKHLVNKAEARLKDILCNDGSSFSNCGEPNSHWLQVSRKARKWQSLIVH